MSGDALDLAAIEARANAATPGPWQRDERYVVGGEDIPGSRPGGEVIAQAQPTLSAWREYELSQRVANAEFIAHAREDVPALVAEVRRLRAEALGHTRYEQCVTDADGRCTCWSHNHHLDRDEPDGYCIGDDRPERQP